MIKCWFSYFNFFCGSIIIRICLSRFMNFFFKICIERGCLCLALSQLECDKNFIRFNDECDGGCKMLFDYTFTEVV